MAQLGAYLEIAGRKPMAWGVNDCMLFAADWLWSVAGQDPAAAWRGRYRTEAGAARIVRKLGGMVPLMMAGATSVGAVAVEPSCAPVEAVGIVLAPIGATLAETAAVRSPMGWAVLSDDGVTVAPFLALAAWAVL